MQDDSRIQAGEQVLRCVGSCKMDGSEKDETVWYVVLDAMVGLSGVSIITQFIQLLVSIL